MEANHLKPTSIDGIQTAIVLCQPNTGQSRLDDVLRRRVRRQFNTEFYHCFGTQLRRFEPKCTALGMVYDAMSGEVMSGMNSPAAGAMFAPLVLRCSHLD